MFGLLNASLLCLSAQTRNVLYFVTPRYLPCLTEIPSCSKAPDYKDTQRHKRNHRGCLKIAFETDQFAMTKKTTSASYARVV